MAVEQVKKKLVKIQKSKSRQEKLLAKTIKKFLSNFEKTIIKLQGRRITSEEVKKDKLRLGLIPPRRVKKDQFDQVRFEGMSRDFLKFVVHTNITAEGTDFTENGSGWVIITDLPDNRLFVREFYRDTLYFKKLGAYAAYARLLIDRQPLCPDPECCKLMTIGETADTGYQWVCNNHTIPIWLTNFGMRELAMLPKYQQKIIVDKEASLGYYIENSNPKQREKNFRTTWKLKLVEKKEG
jgi:hypothetical protein